MGSRSRRCSELVWEQQWNQKFLLVIVDVFSRFMWVRPLKDRKTKSVIEAFQDILSGPRRPKPSVPTRDQNFTIGTFNSIWESRTSIYFTPWTRPKPILPRLRTHWDFVNLILQMWRQQQNHFPRCRLNNKGLVLTSILCKGQKYVATHHHGSEFYLSDM